MVSNDTVWPEWVRVGAPAIYARSHAGRSSSAEKVKRVTIEKVTKRQVTTDDGQVWTQERYTGIPHQTVAMGILGRAHIGRLFDPTDPGAIDRLYQYQIYQHCRRIGRLAEGLVGLNTALDAPLVRGAVRPTETEVLAKQADLLAGIAKQSDLLREATMALAVHRAIVVED